MEESTNLQSNRWEVALTASERQIGASVLGFALVSVIMKGMETNNTQKDRQWILKIHFVCTLEQSACRVCPYKHLGEGEAGY